MRRWFKRLRLVRCYDCGQDSRRRPGTPCARCGETRTIDPIPSLAATDLTLQSIRALGFFSENVAGHMNADMTARGAAEETSKSAGEDSPY